MTRLDEMLHGSPYQGYAYAYPHKTAYRRLPEAVPLRAVWARERRESLFLYLHVPFCEMRCGFCNLFTQARPKEGLAAKYLLTLRREADHVRHALGECRFARFAIGGGTPTFLDVQHLESLFDLASEFGIEQGTPMSVETSPETAEAEKLTLLRELGVTRVSIGIQSFVEAETSAVARPQKIGHVHDALGQLRHAHFPTLNIDLIYGLPGQTVSSWLHSVEAALQYQPEELFLYPLYVRPLTGLGRSGRAWDDQRLACYRQSRDLLVARGYEQVSMRMFRLRRAGAGAGPKYCCQDDGMVGLGCGARSYTRGLHYSREFAVGAAGIRAILADYLSRSDDALSHADYGFRLGTDEQRRRYVLQSLLQCDGLDRAAYRRRFASDALTDLPALADLERNGLAAIAAESIRLNDAGIERSDAIGPWLYSPRVKELMCSFDLQ
jgi:oxygen-independent coproporphyrinogen-3 oxidase